MCEKKIGGGGGRERGREGRREGVSSNDVREDDLTLNSP